MNDQPNHYQLTYLLPPSLDEKGALEIGQKLKKWIEEKQGKIEEEKTTNRNLAYPIKKYQQAVYLNLSFQIIPESVKELQEYLKLEGSILRYAIERRFPRSLSKITKPARVKIGQTKTYPEPDLFRHARLKETEKKELSEKPVSTPSPKEKVKLEELDKKLEEILNE